ncbi:MAG: DEAD/DEAH box helicase [Gemmataceae bacterium]|nr:DEAD/DEAH box helicase [Gemmataceae bacterium]
MAPEAIHFLTIPPSREVAEQDLLPPLRDWFASTFGQPTAAQRGAWPAILTGQNLLLSSPTGSGKTLAAFVPILNRLITEPTAGLRCLYVAPLKALCRDVRVNLKEAWRSLRETGAFPDADLRIGLRTGDTSWRVRQRQLSDPPTILLTTPESLAQMLTQPTARQLFGNLGWVIVDEIHALVGNKRGADLTISLERLLAFLGGGPQRIGLSATCTPLAAVAEFLVGANRPCTVAAVADVTEKQFVIEPLFENLAYSPGWMSALLDRLDAELASNRTTLIFANTRNLAERLTWALRRRYPERSDEIAVHHSALSAARRRGVERRLKQGRLWAVVSSTSLELGIDIGSVDLVVFVHPPGAVVRLLQRVGRSGHRPNEPRRGLLLTASPSELLEAVVTVGSGHDGQIEPVRVLQAPLDVLCQQIVGIAMAGVASPHATFHLIRRALPYRDLAWSDFQDCLDYLSGRHQDGTDWLPARLRWEGEAPAEPRTQARREPRPPGSDADCFTIADARTAKFLRRNLGTILTEDACTIRLRESPEEDATAKALGEVDQIYAERLQLGDRFVLDGRCLELKQRDAASLVVEEVIGRPQIPRWLGAGVPMPGDLARRIFVFRVQAGETLRDGDASFHAWLKHDYLIDDSAIAALARHFQEQETVSEIPTLAALSIECVAMQSCTEYFVHTPLPRAVNETLARVLLHRWTRTHRKDTMALAADLGIYLMTFDPAPIAPEAWRADLSAVRFADDFREHLRTGELLQQHFARVAQTGLMVLRHPAGRNRKVGGRDWSERRLYEQIRTRCPDFLLLRQAESEAVTTTCDLTAASAYVESLASLPIRVRQLAQPSPFGESLLHAGSPTNPAEAEPAMESVKLK